MSVTIIEGSSNADRRQAALNSLKTAVSHAEQGEWLKRPAYQDGPAAYETWAVALERLAHGGEQRMLRYYAGTYLAARYYARRYMDLVTGILGNTEPLEDATRAYDEVVDHLSDVWRTLSKDGRRLPDELREAAGLLRQAKIAEETAIEHIKAYLDG